MLSIRLKRMGRTHRPFYRVVVADRARKPTGATVEELGHYDPSRPEGLVLKLERVDYWLGKGARPSDTVAGLIRRVRRQASTD